MLDLIENGGESVQRKYVIPVGRSYSKKISPIVVLGRINPAAALSSGFIFS